MIAIRSSSASKRNPDLKQAPRKGAETNTAWLKRNQAFEGETLKLLLVGGRSATSFRLRIAQAHARSDMEPSWWSQVLFLTEPAKNVALTRTLEISLEPAAGFGHPAPRNAVQNGKLAAYDDPEAYPNIAVLELPLERKALREPVARFTKQRAVLDAVELVTLWLPFVWGVGSAGNPLLGGHGVPSAAMAEVLLSAVGFELTPSLGNRASCPEAIWQSANWWHEYHQARGQKQHLKGAFTAEHSLS